MLNGSKNGQSLVESQFQEKHRKKNPIKWTLTTYVNKNAHRKRESERDMHTINALNEFNNEHEFVCNSGDQEETMSKA